MIEQYTLEGRPVKSASCTIKTDDGGVIRIRVTGSAAKALMDGFVSAMKKEQERRWDQ